MATHLTDENVKAAKKEGTFAASELRVNSFASGASIRGTSCQGFALAKTTGGRVLVPQALVDPGDPTQTPSGYGSQQDQAEVGDVAVVDEASGDLLLASLQALPSGLVRSMQASSVGHDH
jgi:hypothetical protein